MNKKGMKLFSVYGIDINLHFSWWFIFVLLAYALAIDFFPNNYPGFNVVTYWVMGVLASLLLFVSVLLHELTHSFVARVNKIKVESITLFFFGGVASLPSEDLKAKTEFLMALSGPLFSLALAGVLYVVHIQNLPVMWKAITFYLYQLNFILAVFNLVPGYPLDGGRVFRAVLFAYLKDIRKATYIASRGGKFFGGVLIFLGLMGIFFGAFGGLWFVFLGGFLWFIAKASYEQVVVKDVLGKMPLSALLNKKYVALKPNDTFDKVVALYKKVEQDSFVVEKGKKFLGIVDMQRVGRLPRDVWRNIIVGNVMIPAERIRAIGSKENAYDAFRKFEEQRLNVLPVIEKGKVKGVVSKKRLVHHLALQLKYGFEID